MVVTTGSCVNSPEGVTRCRVTGGPGRWSGGGGGPGEKDRSGCAGEPGRARSWESERRGLTVGARGFPGGKGCRVGPRSRGGCMAGCSGEPTDLQALSPLPVCCEGAQQQRAPRGVVAVRSLCAGYHLCVNTRGRTQGLPESCLTQLRLAVCSLSRPWCPVLRTCVLSDPGG